MSSSPFAHRILATSALVSGLAVGSQASAQTIEPPFDADYELQNLGRVPGVPGNLGGVCFQRGDARTLLVGGRANRDDATAYSIPVVRDQDGHIIGFEGTAQEFAPTPFLDAGLAYGPDDVLFYTRSATNELGQIPVGSTDTTRVIDLSALGIEISAGGLHFVPAGYPGAGGLKITSYGGSGWYSGTVVPDGSGTFDLVDVGPKVPLDRSPEGFAFVPPGSPGMQDFRHVLINEYLVGSIARYELDDSGDPIPASRVVFATGAARTFEGMVVDPVTGDVLVSSFKTSELYCIRGFAPPCPAARWSNYGDGWPGTGGVPEFSCSAEPVLGTTLDVHIGNSAGSALLAFVLLGFEDAEIPTNRGGTLRVVPFRIFPFSLPATGRTLPVSIPDDVTLCGLPIFAQAIEPDVGASRGLAFSAGLSLVLGR